MTPRLSFLAALAVLAFGGTAAAAEHVVSQQGRAFQPGTLSARVGDTVVFVNDDGVIHNVFSESEALTFNLGSQKPGERMPVALRKPGRIAVECQIHPKMMLTIDVQ